MPVLSLLRHPALHGWRSGGSTTIDVTSKLRRMDVNLAALNFVLSGAHMLFFPCCALSSYSLWSRNAPLAKNGNPDALPLLACIGGVLLLGGALCCGIFAGLFLLTGNRWGRPLTAALVVLASFHVLLAICTVAMKYQMDFSKLAEGMGESWPMFLAYCGPSFVYCLTAPVLLRNRNRLCRLDGHEAARIARLLREYAGDSPEDSSGNPEERPATYRPASNKRMPE